MLYESTRGSIKGLTSVEAIIKGIAPDGGLFVPEHGVRLDLVDIEKLVPMNYQERAIKILKLFLNDYSEIDLADCVTSAYDPAKFNSPQIAPLVKLNETAHILELWHGPTCAFKDMALQILPHFLVKALKKSWETSKIVILVATSGDTGKAAMEGFKDVAGTKVIVFFPDQGVSEIQRTQMVTQEGKNVFSIAVHGANFDDAQNGVKAIFSDSHYNAVVGQHGYKFSSANSINWGRLAPQIVYYFSAYADLTNTGEIKLGDPINIVVPTGNFGNILAAYYALTMGLPVHKLICASNDNNILTDLINTGVYNIKRDFKKTISPSMDILISNNLERLLFELTDHDPKPVKDWLGKLKNDGIYTIDAQTKQKIGRLLWADFCTEEETLKTIKKTWEQYSYVADTHTAVALNVYEKYLRATGDRIKTVIASTASPFKFNESVVKAIFGEEKTRGKNEFELLNLLSQECDLPIPEGLNNLEHKEILHRSACSVDGMKNQVNEILGVN